jgi:signal transduction histidine kinase
VDGGNALIRVDDGCGGIPEQEIGRLFEVAFRGTLARTPNTDTEAPVGAGLGLAIARGLVEAHHGQIDARNHGPGCRFEVRLPLAAV